MFTTIVMVMLIVWAFKQIASELKLGDWLKNKTFKDEDD